MPRTKEDFKQFITQSHERVKQVTFPEIPLAITFSGVLSTFRPNPREKENVDQALTLIEEAYLEMEEERLFHVPL